MFAFNPATQKFPLSTGQAPASTSLGSPLADEPPKDRRFVDVRNGTFVIIGSDGKAIEADLGTLMMMISMKRTSNLDNQIALQLDDIQKRNAIIGAMTDAMNKARQAKQDQGKDSPNLISVKPADPSKFEPDETWKMSSPYKVETKLGPDGKMQYIVNPGNMSLEDFKRKAVNHQLNPQPVFEHLVPDSNEPYKYTVRDPITGEMLSLREFAKRYDIPWKNIENGKDKSAKDDWEANIANIKSRIDILNNDSQMANIKLQNVLEKRNNSFEMCTKVMQTNNSSVQSILRNL